MRKYLFFILICTFLFPGILYLLYSNSLENEQKTTKTSVQTKVIEKKLSKKSEKVEDKNISTPKRDIASIKPKNIFNQREVIGSYNRHEPLKFANAISKDWKDKFQSNLVRNLKTEDYKDINIELKNSLIKVNKNVGVFIEHILVTIHRPDGSPFSYEAHIDSQTGSMIQSWNKTKYEFKNKLKLNPTGRGVRLPAES